MSGLPLPAPTRSNSRNGQGALVRNIAETELGPYVASRFSVQGSDVLLPPKYALTVALMIHELATNAAKYGALSKPEGHVSLLTRMSEELLYIEWRETAGPSISLPKKPDLGCDFFREPSGSSEAIPRSYSNHRDSSAK
jgi:two-component sensor histidine kinase